MREERMNTEPLNIGANERKRIRTVDNAVLAHGLLMREAEVVCSEA